MDHFLEEGIARKGGWIQNLIYVLTWVVMIVTAVAAAFFLTFIFQFNQASLWGLPLFALNGVVAFLCYRYKDRIRTEYECAITNGLVEIAAVYNNTRRREVITFKMKDVLTLALAGDEQAEAFARQPGAKKVNITLDKEKPAYLVCLAREDGKFLIRMQVSPEFANVMRLYLPHGANARLGS